MATVRHSTCRIDFDPSDVTGKSIITVSDSDGVVLDTIEIKTTHLVAAVEKQTMVQVRRNMALARILSEMDDEINAHDTLCEDTTCEHSRYAHVRALCGKTGV